MVEEKRVPELRFKDSNGEDYPEWGEVRLGDIFKIIVGGDVPKGFFSKQQKKEYKVPVYSNSLVDKGLYGYTSKERVTEPKTVTVTGRGEIGVAEYRQGSYYPIVRLLVCIPKKEMEPAFYSYNINTITIFSESTGVPQLTAPQLASNIVKEPSIEEQKKIGNFFQALDKRITLQSERVTALRTQKEGLLQRVFDRELRFKDENGEDYPEWEEVKLGDVFKERAERGQPELELLSVTMSQGIKKQSELGGVDNSSANKENYKVARKGDIAYNSMRMWQGASGVSPMDGIISPAYTVLELKKIEDIVYWGYAFKTRHIIQQFKKYSQGLTSDTWTLRYPLLKTVQVKATRNIAEQKKIGNFFSLLDEKIELEQRKLEAQKQEKKALMQRMFV